MRSRTKPITVRNLPPGVAKAVREKAKRERLSLNGAVVRLLAEATGVSAQPKQPVLHHDLDRFAGVWSGEEADAFDELLGEQRAVHREDWT